MKVHTLPALKAVVLFLLLVVAPAVLVTLDAQAGPGGRQTVIDFEDEVVEGVNKRPLDSLSQISEKDRKRKKTHLYRKRGGFRAENRAAVRELRYVQ